jgi:amino acid adenylation domain-containing protein
VPQPREGSSGETPEHGIATDAAARRARVDQLLAERDAAARPATRDPSTTPRPTATDHPLSLGQEQIWVHSRLSSDPSIYNEPLTLTHRGPLDVDALRRSLEEIVRRHEAWRTVFREVDGRPVAIVQDPPKIDLPVVDLRHLEREAAVAEAVRLATDDARRPFSLEFGPNLRFLLVVLGEGEQRLYLTLHQIIFDGVSMYSGFLPEVASIYADLSSNRDVSIPEPAVQYRDFVHWQRETATDRVLSDQLGYWRRQLGEYRPPVELPTDRPRPAVQRFDGAQISFALPEGLSADLRAFSRREGVTLFATLLAAFSTYLLLRTGDSVPTVGSVKSVRKRAEYQTLLGFFLNTLTLRLDLSDDPSFRDVLGRARNTIVDALSHDDVPIHRVIQELSLPRDASRSPLFQTMLVLEPPLPVPAEGWELSQLDIDVGRSRVDFYLEFDDRPETLIGRIRYSTALFDRAKVESMLSELQTLMRAAIEDPDRPIGELSLLTDDERLALLAARNKLEPATPFEVFEQAEIEQTIPARFARQVSRNGDRTAVTSTHGAWTYRQLQETATTIGWAVWNARRTEGPRVGLLARPGAPQIAAIVGILMAGGAYVPLDPDFPAKRIEAIARDAQITVALVEHDLVGLAAEALPKEFVTLDLSAIASGERVAEAINRGSPDDPAYILYTSGSTGEPKGILQTHRNVLHHIRAYTNALHLASEDRLLLVAKITFDASVMDVFGALLNGATLCVVNLAAVGFLGLRRAVAEEHVTVYHSTPTVYRELLATLEPGEQLADVRLVVLGGEEVRTTDLERFVARFAPGALLVNGLGPTESTLALQYFADSSTVLEDATVPVGYPVEDTDVVLVDSRGRPNDFVGEITIRSRYVAPGYWNRPELTAAVFADDPNVPGAVTYRTGDLGRRRLDGAIEYGGRRDRQVKIRGIRVEIGEVERAVAALPGVQEAAVELRTVQGEARLVAYLVPLGLDRPPEHDILQALRGQLPEYMIPTFVVWLDRLPLTSSNKIDRLALPAPSVAARLAPEAGPRDPLEQRLIAIWEEILGRRPVGVAEDFFELGGHSLLAVRLFDRIWRETGQRVPLSALLEGATVEHLAAQLREGQSAMRSPLIALQPNGTRPPVFVVPGTGSRILYLRSLPPRLGPDQPVYALRHPPVGPDGLANRRVEDVASEYLAALREVQPKGPYHLVGYSFGGAVAFEIAQQLMRAGEVVRLLAIIDTASPSQVRPKGGVHLRFVPRLTAQQLRLVLQLGPRAGASYMWHLAGIAFGLFRIGFWEMLDRKLPNALRPMLWRDPIPAAEREWLAADARAYKDYRPAPYPGSITFLWAEHSQLPSDVFDTRQGWADLAQGGLEVRPIPGSHLSVFVEPVAGITAAVLADLLGEAQESAGERPQGQKRLARW